VTRDEPKKGRSQREVAHLDWFPDDPIDGMPALVTAVGPVINWIDDDNPNEAMRGWCVALGFEQRHDGVVELVDLRLFSRGTVTAIGRAIKLSRTQPERFGDPRRTRTTVGTRSHVEGLPAPWGGLSYRLLRRLKVGALEAAARRQMTEVPKIAVALPKSWAVDAARRPGSRGRDDVHYAEVAAAYVAAFKAGSDRPVVDVADSLYVAPKTVSNKLFRARERGLLTSPPRGRAGGELTGKAKALLRDAGLMDEEGTIDGGR
jgi:hypothetical protein